ncbi:MAG: site-specific integrase, partial [Caldilineaceae bacterium]|nr:site-specific integrase [Caldilineaceae bacterium]
MSKTPAAPTSAGEGVLAAIQDAALGLARPYDSEQATRFEAALEALAPNTRRAYGSALATWGRWAALLGIHALTPSPFALRAYLQERAQNGAGISSLRLTVAALRKV